MAELRSMRLKHSEAFLSGILGGAVAVFIVLCLFKAGFLTFERKPSFAIVDTQKIIRARAKKLATTGKSIEVLEDTIEPFIENLDQALIIISKEKNVLLLQPSAVASSNIPDLTHDVQKRLSSHENLEKKP